VAARHSERSEESELEIRFNAGLQIRQDGNAPAQKKDLEIIKNNFFFTVLSSKTIQIILF
jgi:hypothetical protein